MILYVDASCLLKRYVLEEASADVDAWMSHADFVATASISLAEVAAELARRPAWIKPSRVTRGRALEKLTEDWDDYIVIETDERRAAAVGMAAPPAGCGSGTPRGRPDDRRHGGADRGRVRVVRPGGEPGRARGGSRRDPASQVEAGTGPGRGAAADGGRYAAGPRGGSLSSHGRLAPQRLVRPPQDARPERAQARARQHARRPELGDRLSAVPDLRDHGARRAGGAARADRGHRRGDGEHHQVPVRAGRRLHRPPQALRARRLHPRRPRQARHRARARVGRRPSPAASPTASARACARRRATTSSRRTPSPGSRASPSACTAPWTRMGAVLGPLVALGAASRLHVLAALDLRHRRRSRACSASSSSCCLVREHRETPQQRGVPALAARRRRPSAGCSPARCSSPSATPATRSSCSRPRTSSAAGLHAAIGATCSTCSTTSCTPPGRCRSAASATASASTRW